jgi:hypothetical protein
MSKPPWWAWTMMPVTLLIWLLAGIIVGAITALRACDDWLGELYERRAIKKIGAPDDA